MTARLAPEKELEIIWKLADSLGLDDPDEFADGCQVVYLDDYYQVVNKSGYGFGWCPLPEDMP